MIGPLILTYHAVERGPAPLCFDPEHFGRHLDRLAEARVETLTVSGLAARLNDGTLPERAVALTFDDGFASAARFAVPLLLERGLTATMFCVAGRLGGLSDWPTQPPRAPRLPLAEARELSELAAAGIEIGAHGWEHSPLTDESQPALRRELDEARARLEHAVGSEVRSFAFPYGAMPEGGAREALERAGYRAACTASLRRVRVDDDAFRLPRVDAWYLRSTRLLGLALQGRLPLYLDARRVGARARRAVRKDFVEADAS